MKRKSISGFIAGAIAVCIPALYFPLVGSSEQLFLGLGTYCIYQIGAIQLRDYIKRPHKPYMCILSNLIYMLVCICYGYFIVYPDNKSKSIILLPTFFAVSTLFTVELWNRKGHFKIRLPKRVCAVMLCACLLTAAIPLVQPELFYTKQAIQMAKNYVVEGVTYSEITTEDLSDEDCNFDFKEWNSLLEAEKEDVLNAIIRKECQYLGVSFSPKLIIKDIPPKGEYLTCAQYMHCERKITINRCILADAERVVRALLHEIHHCYIFFCIDNIDWSQPFSQKCALYSELRIMRNNTKHYLETDRAGFANYESQPLELAASEYSDARFESEYATLF